MAPRRARRAAEPAAPSPSWADLPEECRLRVLELMEQEDRCDLNASRIFTLSLAAAAACRLS